MATTFQANEFSTVLPEGLKDKTVNIFSLTDEGPSELGVVIARDRPLHGETLDTYAERQFKLLQQRLPLFRVLGKTMIEVDVEPNKRPAVQVDYAWQSGEGPMHQRQVIVFAEAAGVVLLFTATSKTRIEPKWEAVFNEMIVNLRLRT